MLAYRTPGVYFEWLDTRPPRVVPLRTDITGFVGIAARGPLHTAVRVESWTQFESVFGPHTPQGYLAWAIEGFFENGGETCWVVRVADPQTVRTASLTLLDVRGWATPTQAASAAVNQRGWPVVTLDASSPGTWASEMQVTAIPAGGNRFTLSLRLPGGVQEIWPNLSTAPGAERYVENVLNDRVSGSRLVTARPATAFPGPGTGVATIGHGTGWLRGGGDGLATLSPNHLSGADSPLAKPWGLAVLEPVDEIGIVAMPDIMLPMPSLPAPKPPPPPIDCERIDDDPANAITGDPEVPPFGREPYEFAEPFPPEIVHQLQLTLVGHCERLRDRVAILDPYPGDLTPELVLVRRNLFDTAFAALYFPWLRVDDPLRLEGLVRSVPPSGHVAGVYARSDRFVGVHKPPANTVVQGAWDVDFDIDDTIHSRLNDHSVNAIRSYPGRGVRVMGARTMSRDPLWRFVNVRRLLLMIEEAIDEQTQWAVFEPNNIDLWRDMDRAARTFLEGLWQRGMLDGATAEEAFSVTCDTTTNPPEETDLGRMTCLIGVQPPYPAEFVIVRIGKTEFGTAFLEGGGIGRG